MQFAPTEIISNESINLFNILLWCFLSVGLSFIGALLWFIRVVSIGVVGELKTLNAKIEAMGNTMIEIKDEFRSDLAKHDTRITLVEHDIKNAVERRRHHDIKSDAS